MGLPTVWGGVVLAHLVPMMRRFLLLGLGLSALVACSSGGEDGSLGGEGGGKAEVTASNPFGLSPEQCAASPAPAVFGNGLCVCGDFNDVGNLIVSPSSDGSLGSVGVNGATKIINNAQVAGSWASGKDFSAIGNVNVGGSMYTPGDLSVAGNIEIAKNLHVGGAMSGFGRLAVRGELGVRGQNRVIGYQQIASKGSYEDAPEAPCGCKNDKGYLDVGAAIDRAKSKNDNGAKKVPTSLGQVGYTDVTLETGSYYFGGAVDSIGFQHIRVKGAVSMYIDGSLDQIGAEVFDIADGSTLDLYVRGAVRTIGHFRVGDAKQPAALRLFIGGGDEISLAIGNQIFHGAIYAPDATLKYVGNTIVEGALFAKELTGIGNLEIRAARPTPPTGCPGAPSSSGGGTSGGGTPGPSSTPSPAADPPPRDDGVGTPVIR